MTGETWWRWRGRDLELLVRVIPRAGRDSVEGARAGRLRVRLAAPPVEGAANERLVRFMASEFGVPQVAVRLLSGHRGRSKRLQVGAPRRLPDWAACAGAAPVQGDRT